MIGKNRIAFTSLVGLLLASLGLISVLNLERIQRRALEWFMVLKPNSMLSNLWQKPSLDITASVYIFNWTNSEQFNNPNVKPRFEELGPYCFTETQEKLNVVWHPENSTVSYLRRSHFYFDEAASAGKLTDSIVAPNMLSVGIVNKIQNWNPMLRTLMLMALNMNGNEATFVRSADDWLFNGFDTPLIKMSKMIPNNMMPDLYFPYERIGYGYPRNGSTQIYGHHNVHTGQQDFSKVGQIARWRYDNVSAGYPNCKLRGSTGEFHPTPLRQGEPISYFLPDLCREMQLDYAGTTLFKGIEAYVYKGTARNLANGTDNPENSCYCTGNCREVRSGLMNVSSCWYDVPVFASSPHFYNADPYYADAVEGMKPDKDRHEMSVMLEPSTGILLDIKARLMISLLVEPRRESIFRKSRRNFFPLCWVDYRLRISSDLEFYLKLLPISALVGKVCGCIAVALGLGLMLWYPRQILLQRRYMRKIDITNLETRIQAASMEVKTHAAEGSPLLVGLQFVASSGDGDCARRHINIAKPHNMSTGCGSDAHNNSRIPVQAASTTAATRIYKRLASVQRSKSKRTGAQRASRASCTTTTATRVTEKASNTGKARDVGSNRHRKTQQQQQQLEMTSRARHCAWRLGIVILGACCIAAGVYLLRNWIDIFTRMRGKEMALSPTSPAFEGWKVSPLPLNFDVYLFNWTNPEDLYEGSPKKPHFVQLGPYRFREKPDKVDIEWHSHNASVSFRKKAYFFFDAAGSNGTLQDVVTSVNTVAHAGARRFGQLNSFFQFMASTTLSSTQKVSETRTAEEWLFKGFVNSLVTLGKIISPDDVPYDRIGYQYARNGSTSFDGDINMFTGADDISKMGQIYSWNNKTHTGAFDGACGKVMGSMGEFFPPNLSTNDSVYLYMPKMCRAVPLDFTETISVHGVTAYKFSGTRHAVDNGTMYPDTSCLCVDGKCQPAGVINVGRCNFNTSIYMSYPHFYLADPIYLEALDGLQPEKEKHEFFMALEPNAGVPMDVGGGFQANYMMEPVPGVALYARVPRIMLPLMWAEERVRVSEEIAASIGLVPLIVMLGQIFTGILLAGGLICTCWYPTRQLTRLCHSDDPKAKASMLRPLTTFGAGVSTASATPAVQQLFRQTANQNERVGVRLLDYRRSSGIEDGDDECSGGNTSTDRLIESRSTDVIIS
ncbi:uncharacterized protein Dvir_GJ17481 [Drosophila virilis]|uniref:Protein peste n=2 Tax=Drosophila virilis TaxID=7244 RepID=B4LQK1_DROVI|nr:uncharacterized protein Dvir_GJ17481 [Drosophila virilis]